MESRALGPAPGPGDPAGPDRSPLITGAAGRGSPGAAGTGGQRAPRRHQSGHLRGAGPDRRCVNGPSARRGPAAAVYRSITLRRRSVRPGILVDVHSVPLGRLDNLSFPGQDRNGRSIESSQLLLPG
jgi:hypothetical protein